MGSVWLRDVPAWFTKAGIPFREYPGWQTRSRSSGGFDDIRGGVAHHTGSPPTATWQNDCAYMWLNATTRPIGNFHLDRTGIWTLGAAGASNTNGRGLADWHTSRGVIPIEPSTMGNRMAFAVEAASNGVGERWPKVQADSYFAGLAVLCDELGLDPNRDITTHRGWAGTRKSDPFGPVEGYVTLGSQTWPVSALRSIIAAVNPDPPPAPIPPTPVPPSTPVKMPPGGLVAEALIMKYIPPDADPAKDWWGYFSPNDGVTRHGVRGMDHAAIIVKNGARDAVTGVVVTSETWVGVSHTADAKVLEDKLGATTATTAAS